MALSFDDFDLSLKVIIVGNGAVGKTSLIRRFCKETYTDQYKKTIGVDFLEKQHLVEDLRETATLMLWDTAGQEEFDAVTRTYYRGAGACVLAFSTTDRDSFEAVESWKAKVEAQCGTIVTVLIQNKIDLIDDAVISSDEAEQLARKLNLRFYRTSVKDNLNVNQVFDHLTKEYLLARKSEAAIQKSSVGSLDGKAGAASGEATPGGSASGKPSSSGAFQIVTPTTQRTGGKKRAVCII